VGNAVNPRTDGRAGFTGVVDGSIVDGVVV
jgi:hypothetical protein